MALKTVRHGADSSGPMVAVGEAGSGARYAAALCVMYWLLLSYPITLAIASVATILVTALIYLKTLLRRRDSVARLTCKDSALSHYVTLHCHAFRRALQLPVWCRNRHVQTFLGLWATEPGVQFDRKYIQLPDKGLVALDWEVGGEHLPRGRPVLLVLPDLPQSALQVSALCREAFNYGLRAVVVNRRGQGGSPVHTARLPGYGDASDLREVVEFLRSDNNGDCHGGHHHHHHYQQRGGGGPPLSAVGVGTGGDLLMSYLGEFGSSSHLVSAVCISPSYAAERVLHGLPFPYSALYLSHAKRAVLGHARVFGEATARLARSAWTLKELDRRLHCRHRGQETTKSDGGGGGGVGGEGGEKRGSGSLPEAEGEAGRPGSDGERAGERGAIGELDGTEDGRFASVGAGLHDLTATAAAATDEEGEEGGAQHHHQQQQQNHHHNKHEQHQHHHQHHDSSSGARGASEGCDGRGLHADLDAFWAENEPLREADEISAPVLCVSSLDDPVCPASHIQHDLFRALPNLFLLTLPQGGHAGFRQSPRGISWAESAAVDFVLTMLSCRLQLDHHHHHASSDLDDGSRTLSYAETGEKCFEYQCRAEGGEDDDDDDEVEVEEEVVDVEEEVYDSTDYSPPSEEGLLSPDDDVMFGVIPGQDGDHHLHHHHHHHHHHDDGMHCGDASNITVSSSSSSSSTPAVSANSAAAATTTRSTAAILSVATTMNDGYCYYLDDDDDDDDESGGRRSMICNNSSSNSNNSSHCPNGHCSSAVMAMADVDAEKQLRSPTEAHG